MKRGAATRAISAPVRVLPVNEIALTLGCATSAAPARRAGAVDDVEHPGREARPRAQIFESRYAVIGVTSEGLATTVQPAASAGAIFQVRR